MTNYNFKNNTQLRTYLEKKIKYSLEYCAWKTENKLKNLLQERVYDMPTNMYERTFELLESISHSEVVKVGNKYFIEIYYDTDKIRAYPSEDNSWGKHSSFPGDDVSMWIPKWIDEGTNNKYYSHPGVHTVEDCREWIRKEYNRLFVLGLRGAGIDMI